MSGTMLVRIKPTARKETHTLFDPVHPADSMTFRRAMGWYAVDTARAKALEGERETDEPNARFLFDVMTQEEARQMENREVRESAQAAGFVPQNTASKPSEPVRPIPPPLPQAQEEKKAAPVPVVPVVPPAPSKPEEPRVFAPIAQMVQEQKESAAEPEGLEEEPLQKLESELEPEPEPVREPEKQPDPEPVAASEPVMIVGQAQPEPEKVPEEPKARKTARRGSGKRGSGRHGKVEQNSDWEGDGK